MALDSLHHLVCRNRDCAFRVHDRYFELKKRFAAGICPNCGGPVDVCEPFSNDVAPDWQIATDPDQSGYGSVRRVS